MPHPRGRSKATSRLISVVVCYLPPIAGLRMGGSPGLAAQRMTMNSVCPRDVIGRGYVLLRRENDWEIRLASLGCEPQRDYRLVSWPLLVPYYTHRFLELFWGEL